MNKTNLKEKILNLESKLELLKSSIMKEPDFEIDEKNWKKIRERVKRIRKQLYKEQYEKK